MEYDHFARECPNAIMEEEELSHSDMEQAVLQMLMHENQMIIDGQVQQNQYLNM